MSTVGHDSSSFLYATLAKRNAFSGEAHFDGGVGTAIRLSRREEQLLFAQPS